MSPREHAQCGPYAGSRRLNQQSHLLTIAEVSAKTGLSREQVIGIWRSLGFHVPESNVAIFTESDLHSLVGAREALDIFSWDEFLHFLRTVSVSISGVSEAAHNLFVQDVFRTLVNTGVSEDERGRAQGQADLAAQYVEPLLGTLFRRHFELTVERYQARHDEEISVGHVSTMVPMGIGFIDLVGFTSSSRVMDPDDLLRLVTQFEAIAHDVITRHGGRLVKLIGDEVMYAATDANLLCDIAVALLSEFVRDENLTPRGGLAFGDVLPRGNDFYGATVNLASRVGDEAVPGEVLVTSDVAQAATRHSFEAAGRRELKGFPDPVRVSSLVV